MNSAKLSKKIRGNDELIKRKNKQLFGVIALLIFTTLNLVLSRKIVYGEARIKSSSQYYSGNFIIFEDNGRWYAYKIINPYDYSEYMQDGLVVHFIGIQFPSLRGLEIYLLYIVKPNEFPSIYLILLKWVVISLGYLIGIFGILYLLYKLLMIKDRRIYLKRSNIFILYSSFYSGRFIKHKRV
ncbi:MAG: hypothetical protein ACFE91_00780 [Promethearchaeota archaeon]